MGMKGKRGKKVLRLIFASSRGGTYVTPPASQDDAYYDSMIPVEDSICFDTGEVGMPQAEEADTQGRV
jgi:hypothetical protein